MPNLHVIGLSSEEAARFSVAVSALFARDLGFAPDTVYVFANAPVVFRNGAAIDPPVVVRLSWLRQSRTRFETAAKGITEIVRSELGRTGSVQVELHEKWDDATLDGELFSAWAARMGRARP